MDFYERFVDTLGEAGIMPCATLFHWDYPYELFRKGGYEFERPETGYPFTANNLNEPEVIPGVSG
jgi:beta-glucosidase/6-phospho-beta-glucosidase/beta-galactosidase